MALSILRHMGDGLLPVLAGLVPGLVVVVWMWWDSKKRKQRFDAPQTEKLLRPPGRSLSLRLDQVIDRALMKLLTAFALCAFAFPLLASAGTISRIWSISFLVTGLACSFAGAHAALRAVANLGEARNLGLGLRGEQVVAEALQEVGDCGYRAFHDFPGGADWNIDHIVVGPAGVFVIETKARQRVKNRQGQQPSHVVNVIEDTLRFVNGDDANAIPQAERNAKWLAGNLTKRTGDQIDVSAMVVLPGWFVEIKKRPTKGTGVMNANYLTKFLRGRAARLSPAQVQRIIAQVDEKCRDVEF